MNVMLDGLAVKDAESVAPPIHEPVPPSFFWDAQWKSYHHKFSSVSLRRGTQHLTYLHHSVSRAHHFVEGAEGLRARAWRAYQRRERGRAVGRVCMPRTTRGRLPEEYVHTRRPCHLCQTCAMKCSGNIGGAIRAFCNEAVMSALYPS